MEYQDILCTYYSLLGAWYGLCQCFQRLRRVVSAGIRLAFMIQVRSILRYLKPLSILLSRLLYAIIISVLNMLTREAPISHHC